MRFIVRVIVASLAVWLTSLVLPTRVDVLDDGTALGTVLAVAVVGLVLTLINLVIKPIVKALTGCILLLTLGLFSLVINAGLLWLVVWISDQHLFGDKDWGLHVEGGFWWYVVAAAIIALFQVIISTLTRSVGRRV
jgi:putative membrane protein